MASSPFRKLALVGLLAAPALILRVAASDAPSVVALVVFGLAVLAASFLLAWAAEAAQVDISGGLAIAILALIAVLPEYAVDLYFAYTAGHQPEHAAYAAANMTGSNRLLLGLGWPVAGLIGLRALSRRRGRPVRELLLAPRRRIELAVLAVAGILAFVAPVTRAIPIALGLVLLALFAGYLWRVSRGGVTEPELVGTAAGIAALPPRPRRITVAASFAFAALVVMASAEPFAHALVDTGAQLGVDRFLLVQWLAPLASEAPEFLVAVLLARRAKGDDAIGMLLSSKVNQWTLLLGSIPIAYAFGGGGFALHLDARQVEEMLLTATQTVLGFALLVRLRVHRWALVALLALFAVQFVLPGTHARLVVTGVYAALSVAVLVANRHGLRAIGRELLPSRHLRRSARLVKRGGVTLVGIALLATGTVMLAAPGPGLIVIALALLLLGTEYDWARRRYERVRRRAEALARRTAARPLSLAVGLLSAAGIVAAGVALVMVEELPGSGWASGSSVALAGGVVLASLGYALAQGKAGRRDD